LLIILKNLLKSVLKKDPNNTFFKIGLTHALQSQNNIFFFTEKLKLLKIRNPQGFKVLALLVYYLFVFGGIIMGLFSMDYLLEWILTGVLSIFVIMLIPFTIIPQVLKLSLIRDPLGKHLISKNEILVSIFITVSLITSITFSIYNSNKFSLENPRYLLIGLLIIFVSSITKDFLVAKKILFLEKERKEYSRYIFGLMVGLSIGTLGFVFYPEWKILTSPFLLILIICYLVLKRRYFKQPNKDLIRI